MERDTRSLDNDTHGFALQLGSPLHPSNKKTVRSLANEGAPNVWRDYAKR